MIRVNRTMIFMKHTALGLLEFDRSSHFFEFRLDGLRFFLGDFSLTGLGTESTKSLASFSPRLVTSLTVLMTLIFLSPALLRTTVNSVLTSSALASAPGAAAAAATGTAAAALMPYLCSNSLM